MKQKSLAGYFTSSSSSHFQVAFPSFVSQTCALPPTGKILQFKAKVYPYKWPLRTGLLVLLLLITVLGFLATFKEIHRLNIVLAVLILILLIVEMSMAGKHLTWRNEQTRIVKQQGDGNAMLQQYGSNPAITKILDYVQTAYSCCGITDYRDWATTNWAALVVSIVVPLRRWLVVPYSCTITTLIVEFLLRGRDCTLLHRLL